MSNKEKNNRNEEGRMPTVKDTGNASNPSPVGDSFEGPAPHQLLDPKAETYLREAGNIEDMPDPREQEAADKQTASENNPAND